MSAHTFVVNPKQEETTGLNKISKSGETKSVTIISPSATVGTDDRGNRVLDQCPRVSELRQNRTNVSVSDGRLAPSYRGNNTENRRRT